MESGETFFLPAEVVSIEELKREKQIIQSLEYVEEIINALGNIVLIINRNRQTLFSNRVLHKNIGLTDDNVLIGLRPGEIIHCLHSNELIGGCGTTESCRFCGVALAIKECLETYKIVERECCILAKENGKIKAADYKVTVSPINFKGSWYFIFTICDVSDEKRRKILEKVFIHDIANIAGGLQGMMNYIETVSNSKEDARFEMVKRGIGDLVSEIVIQRELLAAENNELKVKKEIINSRNYIQDIIELMQNHTVAHGKSILITNDFKNIAFISDKVLLTIVR